MSENEKEGYLYDLDNLHQKMAEKDEEIAELAEGAPPNFSALSRSIPTPLISAARQSFNKPRSGGNGLNNSQPKGKVIDTTSIVGDTDGEVSRPMSRQENEEAVGQTVNDMDTKIRELRLIFHNNDPIVERTQAIVKISAFIRGWLARQRYHKYWKAMYTFRHGRVKKFLCLMETDLSSAGNVESGTRSLLMKRNTITVEKIVERWCQICRQTAPFRRANLLAAENKFLAKRLELMQLTFAAFKGGTIGGDSHKRLRQERRAMIERLRVDLKEKYNKVSFCICILTFLCDCIQLQQVLDADSLFYFLFFLLLIQSESKRNLMVTEVDLQRAVYREVVSTSIAKRNVIHQRKIFDHFKIILERCHLANKIASRHKFHRFAGKCFYAWSDWTYSVGSGLERKRWPGPRKYEVHYNQKLVDHFIKMRLKKMTFIPWQRFARTQATVNIMFAQKLTKFIQLTFNGWRDLTKKYHMLRTDSLGLWMGKRLFLYPFVWVSSRHLVIF